MSLLKRIEQGQAQDAPAPRESAPVPSAGGENTSRLSGLSARRVAPPGGAQRDTYFDLKTRVQNKLLAELDPSMDVNQT